MICQGLSRNQSNELYESILQDNDTDAIRRLCRQDLFFLLTIGFRRKDINKDWLYERCREVEASPDGHLDLWAREHYKSTILTYGKSIQDILASHGDNPLPIWKGVEVTIGIFSHTRPIAKAFLNQIKYELETNSFLKSHFSDVLWENPKGEAAKWSLDSGIVVKRKTNPKEATVEAWGLVDGQPTSKHFYILNYDDVVTRESVTTPDQIRKTTEAWELSLNLGAKGGVERYIGTRYHTNDTYHTMMKRDVVIPRIKPATHNGKLDGKPVFMDEKTLKKKRKAMGPYTFACFPKGAPILMDDWFEKPIEEIQVGECVVGYSLNPGEKTKLTRSKVLAINKRKSKVIEATFESGRRVRCTPDHKWYTGRRGVDVGGTDSHLSYVPLGFHKSNVKALISVYDPRDANKAPSDPIAAGYLSGFFDGEGSTSGKSLHFHQSCGRNSHICERLEQSFVALNFDFGCTEMDRPNNLEPIRDYYIRGGRSEQIRFLRQCNPAKSDKIAEMLFENGTRYFGKNQRDRLVSIEEIGTQDVYNIQTETGNYIAYGYATKNCQMLQDPVADKAMGFKKEWLKFFKRRESTDGWNLYILVDPASKKKKDSDYTVISVIGLAPDNNYYFIDGVRDRLNLTQRADKLFEFHKRYSPLDVGYEEYGMQSDIEHMEYVMEQKNYRFNITPLGGKTQKEDRIKKLIPVFESHRFWLPEKHTFVNYEGMPTDFVQVFIDEEYLSFPVSVHDDVLDCFARILDPKLGAEFPKIVETQPKVERRLVTSGMGTGWMG